MSAPPALPFLPPSAQVKAVFPGEQAAQSRLVAVHDVIVNVQGNDTVGLDFDAVIMHLTVQPRPQPLLITFQSDAGAAAAAKSAAAGAQAAAPSHKSPAEDAEDAAQLALFKERRFLKKKLREIAKLEQCATLNADQKAKVAKKQVYVRRMQQVDG